MALTVVEERAAKLLEDELISEETAEAVRTVVAETRMAIAPSLPPIMVVEA